MTTWLQLASYVAGGMVLTNAVPHVVSGVMGRPFQSPFATPPGKGLSSSSVNVLWGAANLVVAYLLIGRVGAFDARSTHDMLALSVGALVSGLVAARTFGRFHGGNTPGLS